MSDESSSFDPEERGEREVAAEAAEDRSAFLGLMPHFYRGEVSQMSSRLERLDLTVDWAIGVIVAVLALSFQSPDNPPYFLLIGMVAIVLFLMFDVRRYRTYDAARSRVRMIEENLFANAFDSSGAVHEDWRTEIGDDLRRPTLKVSFLEALSRRLKRVYLPLLTVLSIAWAFRITVFVPGKSWAETAAMPGIPGTVVVGVVVLFYLTALVTAFGVRTRRAKGEFRGEEVGDWKDTN